MMHTEFMRREQRRNGEKVKNKNVAQKVAVSSMLTAVSMIFSYVESLFPISLGVPGIRLGLANLIVLTGLYFLSPLQVLFILGVRIILSAFLFGNMASLLYSMAGGILSFAAMLLCRRLKVFTMTGVSITGGVCHNMGQLLVAMIVVKNTKLLYYCPVLMIAGAIAGAVIGIVGQKCRHAFRSVSE